MHGKSGTGGVLYLADVLLAVNTAQPEGVRTLLFSCVFDIYRYTDVIMKNKILITILIAIVAGVAILFLLQGKNGKITGIKDSNTQKHNNEATAISTKKPASLDSVEMSTYRSLMGYEITYPKAWISVLAPKGTSPNLEAYAIYPKEIYYGPSPIINILVSKKSLHDLLLEMNTSTENLEKISINGFDGYRGLKTGHPSTDYFFEANGFTYRATYWYSPEYDISQEEALWVLSTFKITE